MKMKPGNANAKSHGAYAKIISPAIKTKFEKFHKKVIKNLVPTGPIQREIVRDIATALWNKREFDRWCSIEFATVITEIKSDDDTRRDPSQADIDKQISELEDAFNEKGIKLARQAADAKGKRAERVQAEISRLQEVRSGALAPLHASRERERSEREESPPLRKLERLEKARAAMDARLDRGLRRLAMQKTFDEINTSKFLEHRPATMTIEASALSSSNDHVSDDEDERERKKKLRSKYEDPDTSLALYRKKTKEPDPDDGDGW